MSSCSPETKKNQQINNPSTAIHAKEKIATNLDAFLQEESIHSLNLSLPKASVTSLKKKPRHYVEGILEYGETRYPVHVKLKGNRSFRKLDDKPALKLRFNKNDPDARFLGLKRLTLNNMVDDPTRMHESVGYSFYRAAGLVAPRTTYASLTLNGEDYGLYLVLESVDDVFLESQFGAPIGGLYEGEYGCDLNPADIPKFDRHRGPKTSRESLGRVAQAAATEDPMLWDPNSPYLDSKAVITYLAISTLLADFDGYWHSHNYLFYEKGTGGPWLFLPWGIDRVFSDTVYMHGSRGRLAQVCFGNPTCTLAYSRRLFELGDLMDKLSLKEKMGRISKMLQAHHLLNEDPRDHTKLKRRHKKRRRMREFIGKKPKQFRERLSCLDQDKNEIDPDKDGFACNDCNSQDPKIYPGAEEICDSIDNDCDGLIDNSPLCACTALTLKKATFHLCGWHITWPEAVDFCESKGLRIATFDNEEQSRAVNATAQAIEDGRWWIGISDIAKEGDWRLIGGKKPTWTYWKKEEPTDTNCGQDCAALSSSGQGKWASDHCRQVYPFVCRQSLP